MQGSLNSVNVSLLNKILIYQNILGQLPCNNGINEVFSAAGLFDQGLLNCLDSRLGESKKGLKTFLMKKYKKNMLKLKEPEVIEPLHKRKILCQNEL